MRVNRRKAGTDVDGRGQVRVWVWLFCLQSCCRQERMPLVGRWRSDASGVAGAAVSTTASCPGPVCLALAVCPASFPPTAPVPLDARQSPSPDPLRGRRPLALRMRRSSSSMSSISPLPATHVRTRRHVGISVRIRNMAKSHSSPPMMKRCSRTSQGQQRSAGVCHHLRVKETASAAGSRMDQGGWVGRFTS